MIMGKNVAVSRPEGKSGNCFTGPNVRLFIYNNGRKIIQNADAVIKWKNLRIRKYRKKETFYFELLFWGCFQTGLGLFSDKELLI
jgi:hypothetical protein